MGSKAHATDDEPCATNNKVTNNMRPKGKLFALLAIFAAIGLVTATGAFTSVQAQRTATVNVTGDSSALLQLNPNSDYAEIDSNGELIVDLTGQDGDTIGNGAEGLNTDATTVIGHIFTITNNGDNDVEVSIVVDGPSGITISPVNGSVSPPSDGFNATLSSGTESANVGLKIVVPQGTTLGEFTATINIEADQQAGYQGS